jgi:hypothetical protein
MTVALTIVGNEITTRTARRCGELSTVGLTACHRAREIEGTAACWQQVTVCLILPLRGLNVLRSW